MTKIKNFRVTLRPREMARWLKKERGLETTPDLELSIDSAIKESKHWLTPAAVYTTLTSQTAAKMTAIPIPKDAVALSLAVVSIGAELGVQRAAAEADPDRLTLLAALDHEALAQSLQFTVRLISEQAKDEECELSTPVFVQEISVASSLAALLGVARIGVNLDATAQELPPHVRMAYWFWTPAGKAPSRRADPAGRAEKVAA